MADTPKLSFEELLARANAQPARRKPSHPEEDLQKACCQWYDLQWGERRINGVKIGRLLHLAGISAHDLVHDIFCFLIT